jgi:hypothetical protein
MGLFNKNRNEKYDDDDIVEDAIDTEGDSSGIGYEDDEDISPKQQKQIVRRQEKPIVAKQVDKERYKVGYQPEILYVTDAEDPDKPIVIKISRRLEKYYPQLTLDVKQLNYSDKLSKSV